MERSDWKRETGQEKCQKCHSSSVYKMATGVLNCDLYTYLYSYTSDISSHFRCGSRGSRSGYVPEGRGMMPNVRGRRNAAGSRGAGGVGRGYLTRSAVYQHANYEVSSIIKYSLILQFLLLMLLLLRSLLLLQ